MRKYLAALAVALPFVAAGAAHAATPLYAEIGYTHTSLDSDIKADFNTIDFRGGSQFSKHWGVEMEVGTGLGDASSSYQGTNFNVRMNWEVSVYAVGYLPVAKGLDLFARAGAVGAQFNESAYGNTGSNHENGYAVGVGARWFPKDGKNGIRVDYTRYGMQDDANNIGVSYVRKF
jgi:hypothetical protein